ncbi:transposase [Burkholderia sp. NLJ2]|uniref:transposase n=1 Tax=Burkholderia sp. NLJ2 TaxID=3090699 RepID=UPI003C6C22A7
MLNAERSVRSTYAREFKPQVIKEALEPEASVSIVVRRHDIDTHAVSAWRRR